MRPFRVPRPVSIRTVLLGSVCLSCATDLPRDDLTSYRVLLRSLSEGGGEGGSLVLLTVENEDTGEMARVAHSANYWRYTLSDLGYEWEEGFDRHVMRNHRKPIPVPARLFDELRQLEGEWLPEYEQAFSKGRAYVVQHYLVKTEDEEEIVYHWDHDRFSSCPGPEYAGVVRLLLEAGLSVSVGGVAGGIWAYYRPARDGIDDAYRERELLAKVVGGVLPTAEEHVPLMARYLSDEDEQWAHSHIIGTLGEMGPAGAPALPALLGRLGHSFEGVNAHVLWAIRKIAANPPAVLAHALEQDDVDFPRGGIAWALGELGPEAEGALPVLTELLEVEWARDRLAAARAVWKIMGEAETVVPAVVEVLEYEDKRDRREALELLGEMGPQAADAVPALIRSLDDGEWIPRSRAAETLGLVGAEATVAIPALIDALEDHNPFVFEEAAKALRSLGAAPDQVVPALVRALCDERRPRLKHEAARALGAFGRSARSAVPALARALQKKEWQIECAAADALGRIGPEASPALPLLDKLAREEEEEERDAKEKLEQARARGEGYEWFPPFAVRFAVARAVWRITGEADRVIPTLTKILEPGVVNWQFGAVELLEEMGPAGAGALPALEEFVRREERSEESHPYMKHFYYRGRLAAARALWKVTGDPATVVPVLVGALERGQPWDRVAAAKLLRKLGAAAQGAVQALERALGSRDEDVRAAAEKALHAIRGKDAEP